MRIKKILKKFVLPFVIFAVSVPAFSYEAGDTITFGSYHYEKDGTEKPIEWRILEKYQDGTSLIMSKYLLDASTYNASWTDTTWENSTIREWLNGDFYERAFKDKDKSLIMKSRRKNSDNPKYGTKGGNDTLDNVFLFSADEAKYYEHFFDLNAYPTPYVDDKTNAKNAPFFWWLRTPGGNAKRAAVVDDDGEIKYEGDEVYGKENDVVSYLCITRLRQHSVEWTCHSYKHICKTAF